MGLVPVEAIARLVNVTIDNSARTRFAAVQAIERSVVLSETAGLNCERALAGRLRSRSHLIYMTLDGEVEGKEVRAVVRSNGEVACDRALLARAQLLVSLGDSFDGGRLAASLGSGAMVAALTLTRSCDRVHSVRLRDRGTRAAWIVLP